MKVAPGTEPLQGYTLGMNGSPTATVGGGGVDILPLCLAGIPCGGLRVSNGARDDKTDSYYYYHQCGAGAPASEGADVHGTLTDVGGRLCTCGCRALGLGPQHVS